MAAEAAGQLIATCAEEKLLHGDFITKNLISDASSRIGWVALDPLPMTGDPAAEVAAFAAYHPVKLILPIAEALAQALGLDPREHCVGQPSGQFTRPHKHGETTSNNWSTSSPPRHSTICSPPNCTVGRPACGRGLQRARRPVATLRRYQRDPPAMTPATGCLSRQIAIGAYFAGWLGVLPLTLRWAGAEAMHPSTVQATLGRQALRRSPRQPAAWLRFSLLRGD